MSFLSNLVNKAKKVVHAATEEASRAYDQVNPLDNGLSYQTRQIAPQQAQQSSWQQAAPIAQRAVSVARPVIQAMPIGQQFANIAKPINMAVQHSQNLVQNYNNLSQNSALRPLTGNRVGKYVNQNMLKPMVQTEQNFANLAVGKNPYHGNAKQVAGQVGNDALNAASVIPLGKGIQIAAKGGKVLPRAAEGLINGTIAGTGFGVGYGATGAMKDNASMQDIAKSAFTTGVVGGIAGGVLGGAAPIAAKGAVLGAKGAKVAINKAPELPGLVRSAPSRAVGAVNEATHKTFDGLPPKKIITNPEHLQALDAYQQSVYNQTPLPVNAATRVQAALHDIHQNHGIDFLSGSNLDRANRISDYYEQWRGALGKYQQHLEKPSVLNDEVTGNLKPQPQKRSLFTKLDEKGGGNTEDSPIRKALQKEAAEPPKSQLPPVKRLPAPNDVPNNHTGPIKQGKFARTVKASDQISPETSRQTNASYTSDTTQGALDRAQANIKANGVKKVLDQTLNDLNVKRGTASRDTLAHALELAKIHDAKGTSADQAMAAHLLDLATEHGSASGQQSQILAAIARSSPAGLRNKAFRDIKKGGGKVTPEVQAEIQGHIDAIAKMPDGPAKDFAVSVLQKAVAKHIPQRIGDNAVSVWKAGLLSGVKTQEGNAISNGTFAILKKVSDVTATGIDKALSVGTGKRTKALTGRGSLSGTGEGIKGGAQTLRHGVDPRQMGDKYEQHAEINFGNKWIQRIVGNPANMVFRGMSAADQPFWYASLKNSLYDQAKADGINRGLKGQALLDHMHKTVQNPTERMAHVAEQEANKSTLNYDTLGSKAISFAHKGIDMAPGVTESGRTIAHGVLNVLAPFVRVPSAFISRTVDFTPFGVGKEVFHQVASGQFDQRNLSQAIGEGLTGTGVLALGVALTQNKMLSGDYPKNDPKEAQRWKAEGITPNSVKLGGRWISLNYVGPAGLLLNAGRHIEEAKDESALTKVGASLAGLGQGLLGQSFLQGFSGFSDALNDPARNAKSFINSQASSIVPSIVNDAANVTDRWQRQADTVPESIKNRLPGLRETNRIKQDVYGNKLEQAGGRLNTLSGLKPSNSLTNRNPAIAEVSRLHNVDPRNKDLQVTPLEVNKSLSIENQNIKLNNNQRHDLQAQVGQLTQQKWQELINTPEYKAMNDTEKANALTKIRQTAASVAQREYVVKNNLHPYVKPMTKNEIALEDGSKSITDLSKKASTTSTSDYYKSNDAEYKALKDKYKDISKLPPTKRYTAQKELDRAKVGSSYSKNVRDLYGLSKSALQDYVSKNPTEQSTIDQVVAYGDALANAGIGANKFRLKSGAISLAPATKSSGGGRKTGVGSRGGKGRSTTARSSGTTKAQLPKINNIGNIAMTKSMASKLKSTHIKGVSAGKVSFSTKINKGKTYKLQPVRKKVA